MGVAKLTDQNTVVPAESKYARVERERRYLLQDLPEGLTRASPHVQITDNYITGTRLRLRKVREPQTNKWTVKLTQKFAPDSKDLLANDHHQHLSQRVGGGNACSLRCKRDSQESISV